MISRNYHAACWLIVVLTTGVLLLKLLVGSSYCNIFAPFLILHILVSTALAQIAKVEGDLGHFGCCEQVSGLLSTMLNAALITAWEVLGGLRGCIMLEFRQLVSFILLLVVLESGMVPLMHREGFDKLHGVCILLLIITTIVQVSWIVFFISGIVNEHIGTVSQTRIINSRGQIMLIAYLGHRSVKSIPVMVFLQHSLSARCS